MKNKIFISVLLISALSFSQTDWERWEAKEVSYQIPLPEKAKYILDASSIGDFIISSSRNGYKFLVSDLDGDNCPFQPTCSSFFVEAVKKTNIFQGTLMFSDRFTRDLNLIKVKNQYPLTKDFHFFDPVNNYTLNPAMIKIIPAFEVLDE